MVAGKVDREVLPWLNFTVRFLIKMVMTMTVMTVAVIMVLKKLFSQSIDDNDFEESSSSFFPYIAIFWVRI